MGDCLDVDGVHILIGRVYRQAIKDARRGNREAVLWLQDVAGEFDLVERVVGYDGIPASYDGVPHTEDV
jgi:hypothetical protein